MKLDDLFKEIANGNKYSVKPISYEVKVNEKRIAVVDYDEERQIVSVTRLSKSGWYSINDAVKFVNDTRRYRLKEVELCINMSEEENESTLNLSDLEHMCQCRCIEMRHLGRSCNGWDEFEFIGTHDMLHGLLKDGLRFDDEDIEYLFETDLEAIL